MTAPRNPLAAMWLKREQERLFRRDLAQTARELRELNREAEPLRKAANQRRKERMRQDGPTGFVMVTE